MPLSPGAPQHSLRHELFIIQLTTIINLSVIPIITPKSLETKLLDIIQI